PGKMVALAPMEAPAFTTVLKKLSGYCFDLGFRSLVKVALGPMNTLSSMVIPSHSCTPGFMVTLLPITTSFSIKTWQLILQLFPILAPFKMTQNCQTIVPFPISLVCTSDRGWIIVGAAF